MYKVGFDISYETCPFCFSEVQQTHPIDEKIDTYPYHWGYLSERKKGAKIPEKSIQCDKSIACMLLRLQTSKQFTNEIRKWYKPKTNIQNSSSI